MESDMVENNILNSEDSLSFVKQILDKELKDYKETKSGFYAGNWWINIENKEENILVQFEGDMGYNFSIYIYIDGKKFPLWQYDRKVINATETTKKNLSFQIGILKDFLISENR